MPAKPLQIREDQALWFRSRRTHLAGPGAPDLATTARALVGAQAQQLPPALLGLSQRTQGRPTADDVQAALRDAPRSLVRTWGQRETLHIYDPAAHWPHIVGAKTQWATLRGGLLKNDRRGLDRALARARKLGRPVTRGDLVDLVPKSLLTELAERAEKSGIPADRLGASRLVFRLAERGDMLLGDKVDREQGYELRESAFPDLAWPSEPPDDLRSSAALTRDYLAGFGPASAADVAHFFGGRVSDARTWLDALARDDDLIEVECEGRTGLYALAADRRALSEEAPTTARDWPVRMLPLWDCHLMAHADKSWTTPDEADRKRVWRKAAYVAATVVARGRIVAVWSSKPRAKRLDVQVEPLSGWRERSHAAAVRREAEAVAAHLGLPGANVTIGD